MTIIEYMHRHNLTVDEFAAYIDAEPRTVWNWLKDKHAPRNEKHKKALTNLGVTFKSRPKKIYAFYKSENCLFTGTIEGFADYRCISLATARHAVAPSTHKRATERKKNTKQILGYLLEEG